MDAVEKLPQLKKTDFLSVLTEEPQTVEQVREKLAAEFESIPSHIDFLAERADATGARVSTQPPDRDAAEWCEKTAMEVYATSALPYPFPVDSEIYDH